jgi:hypothetical protein
MTARNGKARARAPFSHTGTAFNNEIANKIDTSHDAIDALSEQLQKDLEATDR